MADVFIVGRFVAETPQGVVWDFQGVFPDEDSAKHSCKDETYWIAPIPFGESLPHETVSWPDAYYPIAPK